LLFGDVLLSYAVNVIARCAVLYAGGCLVQNKPMVDLWSETGIQLRRQSVLLWYASLFQSVI